MLTSSDFYNPYVPLKIATAKRRNLLEAGKHFRSEEKRRERAAGPPGADAETDARKDASCNTNEHDSGCDFADLYHHEESDVIETYSSESDVSLIKSSHSDLKGHQPVAHGCRSVEGKCNCD